MMINGIVYPIFVAPETQKYFAGLLHLL